MKLLFTLGTSIFLFNTSLKAEKLFIDTTKPTASILINKSNNIDSAVLIAVNGLAVGTIKEIKKDVNTLYPAEAIKAIHVWKGEEATNRFGEKAKAGVIEFILKAELIKIDEMKLVEVPEWSEKELADKIFEKVEIEAKYPGGDKQWRMFLEKNLNGSIPVDNGAPAGIYTVVVQFIVSKDGSISDVKPLTDHGYGTEKEVVRVITKGPKWEPAIQGGRMVKAYRKQPVTFMVEDEEINVSTFSVRKNKNNPIEIKVLKTKDEELEIRASNGTINKLGEGMYNVITTTNLPVILTIFNAKKKKEVGKVSLTVLN